MRRHWDMIWTAVVTTATGIVIAWTHGWLMGRRWDLVVAGILGVLVVAGWVCIIGIIGRDVTHNPRWPRRRPS